MISRTLARYLALQAPGWALVGVVLHALVAWGWIAPRLAIALGALWVAKDLALYPWLRRSYEDGPADAGAALVGRSAVARDRLAPRGWVRLGSERWRAELAPGSAPVEAGAAVRVVAVRGLTLVVEPD